MQFERQIGSGAPDQAIEENAPPSIQINPYSELGRELRKWEQFPSAYGPAGNPYVFRAYPKMLYRAQRRPNGQFACMLPAPTPYDFANAGEYERAVLLKDTFDKSCTCIVGDESEERIRVRTGLVGFDSLGFGSGRRGTARDWTGRGRSGVSGAADERQGEGGIRERRSADRGACGGRRPGAEETRTRARRA
jgi:hypothetical protein